MVILSGPQCYAIGPGEYFQTGEDKGGVANVVGIGLGGASHLGGIAEHCVVRDLHISEFYWGLGLRVEHRV